MTERAPARSWPVNLVLILILVPVLVLVGGLAAPELSAQELTIEAQVDREEVAFGEAVLLTVTIAQTLDNSFGNRIPAPRLDRVPGFDIASQRSSQNMSIVNGRGTLVVQTIMELVPQTQGNLEIPSLTLQGPDGKVHTTKPIQIKVLPPPEEEKSEAEAGQEDSPAAAEGGMTFWQGILLILLIIGLTVSLPIILSTLMQKGRKPRNVEDPARNPISGSKAPMRQEVIDRSVQDAEVVTKPDSPEFTDPDFNFHREIERLRREFPQSDLEFFREFFDVFRKALVCRHKKIHQKMTPDETVMLLARNLPTEAALVLKRLAEEWDLVAFAGALPNRPVGQIQEAAQQVLNAIPAQERRR